MSDAWTSRFLPSPEDVSPKNSSGGGHTTLVRRVLERRADRRSRIEEGTTATVAVMLRLLPPPKALLAIQDQMLRAETERRVTADMLEVETADEVSEALRHMAGEFRPVIVTDDLELIRKLRNRTETRTPFIVFISELDEASAREAGLTAGADETIGRRASEREWDARLGAARRVAELESVLRITLEENRKLSATDDLTRVASRRFFGKHFPREVERAGRYRRALSIVLCDIDNFKKINDNLGHAGGDDVLKQFGLRLQKMLRAKVDWVARIGGEEFAVVLPEIDYAGAFQVARKLRAYVAHTPFSAQGESLRVTASFGVCGLDLVPQRDSKTAQRMLKTADLALYRSKHDGRNRVTASRGLPKAANNPSDDSPKGVGKATVG
jgi:two-component system, cell cycle response regulator